uniref:Reverse transcriptase Ty1/copia-type domain-containing protein n=1 Tax=Cannabis sativa TaxID=3483 RepID=A0A803NF93_CANSA
MSNHGNTSGPGIRLDPPAEERIDQQQARAAEPVLEAPNLIPLPNNHLLPLNLRNTPNPAFHNWIRLDQFLMHWLMNSVFEHMLGHVINCRTSHEIWTTFAQLFATRSRARLLQLHNLLQTTKKGSLSIEEYILKMKQHADQLAPAGQPIHDEDLVLYILGGLGTKYEAVVINLTSRTEPLTLQEVQFMLESQEMGIQQQTTDSLHHVQANLANTRGLPSNRGFRGSHRGASNGSNSTPSSTDPPQAFMSESNPTSDSSTAWFLDSGATHHMTNDSDQITSANDYKGKAKVVVSNGSSLSIHHIGSSSVGTKYPNHSLVLQDILHVPNVTKNLLSISQFTKQNHVILEFDDFSCLIKDKTTKQVLLQGHLSEGLYKLHVPASTSQSIASASVSIKPKALNHTTTRNPIHDKSQAVNIWHCRLGYHANFKGYRCLHPLGRIYVARSVTFNEQEFPYTTLFPPTKPTANPPIPNQQPFYIPRSTNVIQHPTIPSTHQTPPITQEILPPTQTTSLPTPTSSTPTVPTSPPIYPSTNQHPMVTRSKLGIYKPKTYLAYSNDEKEPTSFKEAFANPKWNAAMNNEILFFSLKNGTLLLILVYVDDILIRGADTTAIQHLISDLHTSFSLKNLGPVQYFLGFEVTTTATEIYLTQQKYTRDLLARTQLLDSKPQSTPMCSTTKLSATSGIPMDSPTHYRSIIGALQYLTMSRPDIAFSVNKLSQYMQAPTSEHWGACKRLLRYLAGSIRHGLMFKPSNRLDIQGYTDADWAGCFDDRKSTSGYCIFFGGNLISWCSKKQTVVARLSTESEYRALALATAEIIWIQSLLTEICIQTPSPSILLCDNLGAGSLASNPVFHAHTKHIE